MSVHIGKVIKERIAALGMSKSEFARRIKTTPQNAFGIFKRKSIDTDLLQRISQALDYDFFNYYRPLAIEDDASLTNQHGDISKLLVCEKRLQQVSIENAYLKEINQLLREKQVQQ